MIDTKKRTNLTIIVLVIGIITNLGLALCKLFVGLSTNSVTILMDSTNSFLDIFSCVITIIAFILVASPKKKNDTFGLGRLEYVATFLISIVVIIIGGMFLLESINRLSMPIPITFTWENFYLVLGALFGKIFLVFLFYFANRKLNSVAIKALILDSIMDTGITAFTLISFGVSATSNYAFDGYFGLALSIVILGFGFKMTFSSCMTIAGKGGNVSEKQDIKNVLESFAEIKGYDNLLVHDYGYKNTFASIDIEVDSEMQMNEIQKLIDDIKSAIHLASQIKITIGIKSKDDDEQF